MPCDLIAEPCDLNTKHCNLNARHCNINTELCDLITALCDLNARCCFKKTTPDDLKTKHETASSDGGKEGKMRKISFLQYCRK